MRAIVFITVYSLVLFATRAEDAPTPQELIRRMGDPALSVEEHHQAGDALRKIHTKEVIPILIKARTEQNIFDPKVPVSGAIVGDNTTYILHVGQECEDILMELITNGLFHTSKDSPYFVRNWDAWWETHREMTLEQIQAEAHAAYEEYYRKERAQQAALDDRSFREERVHTPQELVHRMGDPYVSVEEHRKASAELLKMGGKKIIPALIEGMKDRRIFDPEVEAPDQIVRIDAPDKPPHKPVTYVETVDKECKYILDQLLSIHRIKSTVDFYPVKDWDAWWRDHRDMTLKQIRQEVQAVCEKSEKEFNLSR